METSDFKELLALFNRHKIEFIVVGGYALAFHGAPHLTGDIDLFIRPTRENAERILASLGELGFESLTVSAHDFTKPRNVIQLGVPPTRVDLITSLTGVSWEKADADKVPGRYGDIPVHFISRDDFIANKKATGRLKDAADLEALDAQ
ncbi:MAG: nucleotidyltransferase family protein [Phycisphaerae bacterium]|nr:nucleotidyltransferase family protein [Phycisphaerae bacterium]